MIGHVRIRHIHINKDWVACCFIHVGLGLIAIFTIKVESDQRSEIIYAKIATLESIKLQLMLLWIDVVVVGDQLILD